MEHKGSYIASASKSALTLASSLELHGTELKHFSCLEGSFSISNTWTTFNMDNVSTGAGLTNRVGRAVRVQAIVIQGTIVPADEFSQVRIICAYRKNGYVAAPGPLLATGFGSLISSGDPTRFLSDDLIGFPARTGESSSSYPTIPYHRTIRFKGKGLSVRYDTLTGHISENYIVVAALATSSAIPHPLFDGFIRVYFTDE